MLTSNCRNGLSVDSPISRQEFHPAPSQRHTPPQLDNSTTAPSSRQVLTGHQPHMGQNSSSDARTRPEHIFHRPMPRLIPQAPSLTNLTSWACRLVSRCPSPTRPQNGATSLHALTWLCNGHTQTSPTSMQPPCGKVPSRKTISASASASHLMSDGSTSGKLNNNASKRRFSISNILFPTNKKENTARI